MNYIILDLEATCWNPESVQYQQEIIEIGACWINSFLEMKKTLIAIILSSFLITGGFAQDLKKANVPEMVKSALLKKFPESTKFKISWEKEKGNYEANWGGKSGEDNSAKFAPTGIFLEIVKAIPTRQLPANALAYIKKNMPNAKIMEAGFVTDANGTVTYEAEMKGQLKELVFDKNGNFLKKD